MTCLPSSHAYQVDPTSGRLQPKCSTDIRSRPYLTKHFLKWVRSDKLKLSSFFVRIFLLPCSAPLIDPPFTPVVHIRVDMPPFLAVLFLTSDTEGGSILTSKIYRRLCSPTVSSSSLYPSLPSTKWTGLWRFPLHPQGRNIWYRMLDNKLDRQGSLYMPSKICPICSGHEETPSRFLFECSQKLAVWFSLWDSQFELPFSTYSLRRAIFLLEFPKCRSNASTVPSIFFGTLLLALCRNHWSFVFDDRPFLANIVIASAKQLLFISLHLCFPTESLFCLFLTYNCRNLRLRDHCHSVRVSHITYNKSKHKTQNPQK